MTGKNFAVRRALPPGLALLFAVMFSSAAMAVEASRAPEIFMDQGGVFGAPWEYAVDGVDVVAYFSLAADAAPVDGDDAFVARYKGVQWRFSSAENLALFEANPAAYAPQYGGYCAWAAANGKRAKGDPRFWYVHHGKLYLNVSKKIQRKWLSDIEGYIERGNANWPGVLEK